MLRRLMIVIIVMLTTFIQPLFIYADSYNNSNSSEHEIKYASDEYISGSSQASNKNETRNIEKNDDLAPDQNEGQDGETPEDSAPDQDEEQDEEAPKDSAPDQDEEQDEEAPEGSAPDQNEEKDQELTESPAPDTNNSGELGTPSGNHEKESHVGGRPDKSIDEWYREGMTEKTASGRVSVFVEALKSYPKNDKLIKGLNLSVENLLAWASDKHDNGDFETAIERYQFILEISTLSNSLKSRTKSLLIDAQSSKRPANTIYDEALKESSASKKLDLYVEGYESYPSDDRFRVGIQDSSYSLLIWARRQHQSENYTTAIDRYSRLLQVPTIKGMFIDSINRHLNLANKERKVPSIDSLLKEVYKQGTVSGILDKSLDAFLWYPEKDITKIELNKSARSLIEWAKGQHEKENYETAIDRYTRVIDILEVDAKIRSEANIQREAAKIKKRSANTIYDQAINEGRASYKLSLFIEGYQFYPNDTKFSKGIRDSANSLFNWAVDKHYAGEFDVALERYELIINAPTLENSNVWKESKSKLADAKVGKRPAHILYELIEQETRASMLFYLHNEGYMHYPEDRRFISGLKTSANNLYELAIRYHNDGDFNRALSRYEKLQSTNGVPSITQKTSELLKDFAKAHQPIPKIKQIVELAEKELTVSGIFEKYIIGYHLYPYSASIINGMSTSSLQYYDYAYKVHENGNYKSAINRYETLISTQGVPKKVLELAILNHKRAKEGLAPEKQLINSTKYSISLEEALDIQMKSSPQTDKYRNNLAYVSGENIEIFEGGSITGNGVNLRTSPRLGTTNNIYSTVNKGTTFEFLDKNIQGDSHLGSKKWYKIKYNNKELYVHSSLASIDSQIGKLTANTNVRSETNTDSHIYGTEKKGTYFTIIKKVDNWYQVNYDTWRNATRSDVIKYLDPMNYLDDDKQIFQFLDLSKSSNVTSTVLDAYLSNRGILSGLGMIFINAAERNGINDLYLVSHAMLETGNGTSALATGVKYNGTTVYNMFGIGAYDDCPLECGAKKAYEEGWTSPEKAIKGGAKFIGNDYVKVGQNTLYKMRWNPLAMEQKKKTHHQYATDIGWAYKQINSLYSLYQEIGSYTLFLDIPLYK